MKVPLIFVGCLLLIGIVEAEPLPVQNPRAQQNTQQISPIATPIEETTAIDEHTVNQHLREKNAQLQRENAELRAENESLKAQLGEYTSKTGSEVHAYCEDSAISKNTAGAETDCNRSGYVCEAVSGMCKTTCQTTDMCAPGWVCDTEVQHCIPAGGG